MGVQKNTGLTTGIGAKIYSEKNSVNVTAERSGGMGCMKKLCFVDNNNLFLLSVLVYILSGYKCMV